MRLETVMRVLENASYTADLVAGAKACKNLGISLETWTDWQIVNDWVSDGRWWYYAAALYACGPERTPMKLILPVLECENEYLREAVIFAGQGRSFEKELVERLATKCYSWNSLGSIPEKMQISRSDIHKWLNQDLLKRYLAIKACANRDVPLKWLLESPSFKNWSPTTVDAIIEVLKKKNIPSRTLRRYYKKYRLYLLIGVCAGRNDMKDIISDAVGIFSLSGWAEKACQGVEFTLAEIDSWRRSSMQHKRLAAAYASIGRTDIPDEWIIKLLNDPVKSVRNVARSLCRERNFPPIRSFEPPDYVYKKCLGGATVIAKIPADAEIRGNISGKARADKALIVDIEGDFYGEKVGVSMYDQETLYRVGDEVMIPDFDVSDKECSTGFHFYSTKDSLNRNY